MNPKPRVHFSGIGGTGMVAGARLAIEAGWELRGSDNPLYPPTSEMVTALGVPVSYSYDATNLDWNPDAVVIGNVLSRGNPEVEAALERRMKYMSLPEWLKDNVLRKRRSISICGTHGKTTTTALTAFLLDRCGLSPGYFIGGQPIDFEHSAKLCPEGNPFVIEGDEYDTAFFDKRAKFFHYLPDIAVVTSLEFDHGDIYPDLASIERAFQLMLRQVPANGHVVLCADDKGADALQKYVYGSAHTYGFSRNAAYRGEMRPARDGFQSMLIFHCDVEWGRVDVPLAGRHNLLNTLAAIAVADILGVQHKKLADALRTFRGVKRRMEVFLESNGVTYVDDFAHHPTAIRETVSAARNRWPNARLRVLFEPRSNTVVTNRFERELTNAFSGANEVYIAPIYRAESISQDVRLDRNRVVHAMRANGIESHLADDFDALAKTITSTGCAGDVVLILSNGAFGGIYKRLRELA
jgi:UDP-N-acetylmuramate: L-alanyl-gamma-D-glutamyl-meso-diaminopimelate ligase